MNLAEIAVELRLPSAPLAEVAFAAYLEVTIAEIVLRRLEEMAARLDLTPTAARLILNQYEERARLLAEAHRILKGLIPHEDKVARLLEVPSVCNVIPLPLPEIRPAL